mmetsp:Transcript_68796/g.165121  ORF Transcript_68796/g.165121 Transcript_68796/m.165121 type:complete len:86 (+) Transcript_68796:90-347(+)
MAGSDNAQFICTDCPAPAPAPALGRFSAFKEVLRVASSNLGIVVDQASVSTGDFCALNSKLITGEILRFEKFRGKVTLVANVASK